MKIIVSCSPNVLLLVQKNTACILFCFVFSLQRKRSAVSGVKQDAQEVLLEGERLLDEANQLSDNINKEIEVLKSISKAAVKAQLLFKGSVMCIKFSILRSTCVFRHLERGDWRSRRIPLCVLT